MHLFPKNPSKSNGIIFHGLSFFDCISWVETFQRGFIKVLGKCYGKCSEKKILRESERI